MSKYAMYELFIAAVSSSNQRVRAHSMAAAVHNQFQRNISVSQNIINPGVINERRVIHRDREAAHNCIMADYFDENAIFSPEQFRCRFKM